ncbi:MAG: HAD-IA family hydrolase [Planctomycetia bacterium]|nr:HAD-IA family hydrolase [Planctomycetia bacterium]
MELRGLIFDCDGTLVDTMPAHLEAWLETLADFNLTLDEDRFYAMGGWPTKTVAKALFDEAGIPIDVDEIALHKETLYLKRLADVTLIEPIVSIAREYRGKLPMAVATGASRSVCERTLNIVGIRDWFDVLVTSDDVTRHKPEPDIFLESARKIGVQPANCRVYEDADPGIEAARRAGMEFVDVRTIYRPRRVTPLPR